jgi:hypothetical protein
MVKAAYQQKGPHPISELTRVVAVRDIHEGRDTVPAGATGTVVFVYEDGAGYEIEFTSPFHTVISARRDAIRRAEK